MKNVGVLFCLIFIFCSCASQLINYKDVEKLEINEEYDQMIQVKEVKNSEGETKQKVEMTPSSDRKKEMTTKEIENKDSKKDKITKTTKKTKKGKSLSMPVTKESASQKSSLIDKNMSLYPMVEDREGFVGRRPLMDPFREGEKIVLSISYFNVNAGELTMETKPMVEVNGRKSYHFIMRIKSNGFFNRVYSVDDWAETFLDHEQLIPYNLAVHIKESKQIKESRSVYDFSKLEANFWEKQMTNDKGEKNKKLSWKIEPYSQNVLSAIFYLRTFTFRKGKTISFKIADAGKNILFKSEVVREEILEFQRESIPTYVLKVEFEQDGIFQKTGDVFIWLTKDDRRFPVRIESKIKIGTLVGALKSLELK